MILPAVLLAMTAAALHALWNVLLKTSGDPLRMSARAMSATTLISAPLVAAAWLLTGRTGIAPPVWGLIALSSVARLGYFAGISEGYRRGELSTVYPIARGTAPLLTVPAGLLLGERLPPLAWVGVACLLAGLWTVRRPARGHASVRPALLAGVCIACYSAVDAMGARQTPPWLYWWGIWAGTSVVLLGRVWLRVPAMIRFGKWDTAQHREHKDTEVPRREGEIDQPHPVATGVIPSIRPQSDAPSSYEPDVPESQADPPWRRALAIGVPMAVAYLLILVAFRLAPLIVVTPVRESAVVLVSGWSVWKLRERNQVRWRLAGTLGVLLGVVLVAV